MKHAKSATGDPVAQLCPACGLCCNGVLFGDVELQRGDDADRLAALGIDLFAKGRKRCFAQPCSCFDGKWCNIYLERPERCRTFECRLVQRVKAGAITTAKALTAIKSARRLVDSLRRQVRKLGQTDEGIPLNRRYAAALAQPIDLAVGKASMRQRSQLMRDAGALAAMLKRDFLD